MQDPTAVSPRLRRGVKRDPGDMRTVARGEAGVRRPVKVIDVATGKTREFRLKEAKRAFMIQPGVLVVHRDGDVEFYDATTGKQLGTALQKGVDEMTVSPAGVIATAQWNGKTSVTLWSDREHPVEIPAPGLKPSSESQRLRFSPDGSRLGYFDYQTVRIVDVDAGKVVLTVTETGLGPKFYGWTLLSKDLAVALSTAEFTESPNCRMQVSTLALTAENPKFEPQIVLTGFDGTPALGPAGVLVNRGLFLESKVSAPVAAPAVVWFDPAALAKAPKKAPSKAAKPKPRLHLSAAALEAVKACGPAFEILCAHTELEVFTPKTPLVDGPLAEAAAKLLTGAVLSSDIDWEFMPCVLDGDDLKGATVKVVKTGKKIRAGLLLSDMTTIAVGTLDEYLSAEDQAAHRQAAALLEGASPVRQLRLTDDDESCTVLLTLARTGTGSPGILAVRIDT